MMALGDFESSAELDQHLGALALTARENPVARNRLFDALRFKIARFCRRHYRRVLEDGICEPVDVDQEGFLVFCELVERWPGERSFLGYFFSRFPWRLARAIDNLARRWPGQRLQPIDQTRNDHAAAPSDAITLIDAGATLKPRERAVLALRVVYQLHVNEIAAMLGVSTRTIIRSCSTIATSLVA